MSINRCAHFGKEAFHYENMYKDIPRRKERIRYMIMYTDD